MNLYFETNSVKPVTKQHLCHQAVICFIASLPDNSVCEVFILFSCYALVCCELLNYCQVEGIFLIDRHSYLDSAGSH